MLSNVVMTFFTASRARSAPGPTGGRSWQAPREDDARPRRGAAPAGHRAGLSGGRCAPGRRLAHLGSPGYVGVGAQAVPAAHRTGWAPATISARRANCKPAILPARVGAYRKDGKERQMSTANPPPKAD